MGKLCVHRDKVARPDFAAAKSGAVGFDVLADGSMEVTIQYRLMSRGRKRRKRRSLGSNAIITVTEVAEATRKLFLELEMVCTLAPAIHRIRMGFLWSLPAP